MLKSSGDRMSPCEVEVCQIERGFVPRCFLYCPVERLHLPLRAAKAPEPLLRGVQKPVPLAETVQPVSHDRGQYLVSSIQYTYWAVAARLQRVPAWLVQEPDETA